MGTRDIFFYIGTYTNKSSKGIYGFRFDPITKQYTDPKLMAEMVSPTYLLMNHTKTVLYAASEPTDGSHGSLAAFAVNPVTGTLSKINEVQAPGQGLCHISLDKQNKFLFAVCYSEATVQVYRLNKDGSIGEMTCMKQHFGQSIHPTRQKKAHAHATCLTPDERYLCVCDLGMDQLVVYDFNSKTGLLQQNDDITLSLPSGCGPRHIIFHPNERYAYIVAELSSQVILLSYDENMGFKILQVINALENEECNSIAAAIRIEKTGKHLYASNRGENSIALFNVNTETGILQRICNTSTQGKTPRDFMLDETGSFLICANQDSDNIIIYDVNTENGTILPNQEIRGISMPVCIVDLVLNKNKKATI